MAAHDSAQSEAQMTGVQMIAAERERQVAAEGWTAEHDDEHTDRSLATAAARYAERAGNSPLFMADGTPITPERWPWEVDAWKPTGDPIRDLAKAGALIAAEIDRLKRAHERV